MSSYQSERSMVLLGKYLGESDKTSGDNYAYRCPYCQHPKKKLEFNVVSGFWNCWVCSTKGRGVFTLLKKMGASSVDIDEAKLLFYDKSQSIVEPVKALFDYPKGFKYLYDNLDHPLAEDILYYLVNRGIYLNQIKKYKIGFISSGERVGNLVFPSYDASGNLNYFVEKNIRTGKYSVPHASRNMIFYDFFIDWEEDIILVEGVFDAISVGDNAIPLLGKWMSPMLREKILISSFKNIYVCLDSDAKEQSIKVSKYLLSVGVNTKVVDLPEGEDPSSLGSRGVWDFIKSAKPLSESDIFKFELTNKLV